MKAQFTLKFDNTASINGNTAHYIVLLDGIKYPKFKQKRHIDIGLKKSALERNYSIGIEKQHFPSVYKGFFLKKTKVSVLRSTLE